MNCQEMERLIPDWARSGEDAQQPDTDAVAHLRECAQCSEALEAQRRLTEGLGALARSFQEEQTPERVEERLGAAFRQHHAVVSTTPRRSRWIALAAVPAAGLVAAGIFLFPRTPQPPAPASAPRTVASVSPAPAEPSRVEAPVVVASRRPKKTPRRQAVRERKVPNEAPRTESAAEFLPVLQGDGWTPLDGAKVMRVELPESAFGAMGLPAPAGNGLERVQADVMLSDDGLVRGVRFVSLRQ